MKKQELRHYIYLIAHKRTRKLYIGVRTDKHRGVPDILTGKYKTSTLDEDFARALRESRSDFYFRVLQEFNTREEANLAEAALLKKYGVASSGRFYNKSENGNEYSILGMVAAKNADGKTCYVSVDDERLRDGTLRHVNSGMVTVKDELGNIFQVDCNDERFLNGILTAPHKGKVNMQDKDGNNYLVLVDDPRIASGELFRFNKDKAKMQDKDGNKYFVSVNDPRIASGELFGLSKGKVKMQDKNGDMHYVSVDDPRIASGELWGLRFG